MAGKEIGGNVTCRQNWLCPALLCRFLGCADAVLSSSSLGSSLWIRKTCKHLCTNHQNNLCLGLICSKKTLPDGLADWDHSCLWVPALLSYNVNVSVTTWHLICTFIYEQRKTMPTANGTHCVCFHMRPGSTNSHLISSRDLWFEYPVKYHGSCLHPWQRVRPQLRQLLQLPLQQLQLLLLLQLPMLQIFQSVHRRDDQRRRPHQKS